MTTDSLGMQKTLLDRLTAVLATSITLLIAMSWLFSSPPPSYAEEQAYAQLSALSTLPIDLTGSSASTARASEPSDESSGSRRSPRQVKLESALHELTSSRSISHDKLIEVLRDLAEIDVPSGAQHSASAGAGEQDGPLEAEVFGRAITVVWKEVMQAFVEAALKLDEERSWWDGSVHTRRGVGIYLVQSGSSSNLGEPCLHLQLCRIGCTRRSSQRQSLSRLCFPCSLYNRSSSHHAQHYSSPCRTPRPRSRPSRRLTS